MLIIRCLVSLANNIDFSLGSLKKIIKKDADVTQTVSDACLRALLQLDDRYDFYGEHQFNLMSKIAAMRILDTQKLVDIKNRIDIVLVNVRILNFTTRFPYSKLARKNQLSKVSTLQHISLLSPEF